MACRICAVLGQLTLNRLLLWDKALNTDLGGDPNETVSRRIGRARRDGSPRVVRIATAVCAVLSAVFNVVLRIIGEAPRDHCTWSMGDGSIGAEVIHWSPVNADAQKTVTAPAAMREPAAAE